VRLRGLLPETSYQVRVVNGHAGSGRSQRRTP